MVAVDANGNPVYPSSGHTGVTVVPHELLGDLMQTLGDGSRDLKTVVTTFQKNRPERSRFGGSALGEQLAAKVDAAYDDLEAAINDAMTGLMNYRTGLQVYRDRMGDVDGDAAAKARRQEQPPAVTSGDDCLDDSSTTACVATPPEDGA